MLSVSDYLGCFVYSQPRSLFFMQQVISLNTIIMVIDDPTKWNGPRIILKVGSKAVFKFVHAEWPILSSVALFDAQNNQLVQEKEAVTYYLNSSVDKEGLKTEINNGVC